jgi:hypothetical protein
MKYLITENKLNTTIKRYIIEMYPIVNDVFFTTKNVVLASTKGTPTVEQTTINIIIDNSKNEFVGGELRNIERDIKSTVDSMFNLKHMYYSSPWNFNFLQLAICSFTAHLPKLK